MAGSSAAAQATSKAASALASTIKSYGPNPAVATKPGILDTFATQAATKNGWIAKHGKLALNTGIKPAIEYIKKNQPAFLTPTLVSQVIPTLPGLFGGYPQDTQREHGADIALCVIFGLLFLGSLFIFVNNLARKHNFYLMIGIVAFCACKVIGFATRYVFGTDVTDVNMGIVSVVFTQVPQLIIMSTNHVFAHRVFTWRHPETGNSWWVNLTFNIMYFLVVAVVVMAIVGQCLPYTRFMTEHSKNVAQNVTMAAAILNLVYGLIPFQMVFFAYLFKPGVLTAEPWKRRDVDRVLPPVYQANWIESTNLFYYVPRGVQHQIYRDEPAAKAIRVIPSREAPAGGIHDIHSGPITHPNSPRVLVAVLLVLFGATIFLLNTSVRVAAVFGTYRGQHPTTVQTQILPEPKYSYPYFPFNPIALWVFYGGLEALVIFVYLSMRVDLRFYIPDMAKRAGSNPHPYNGSEYTEPKQLNESA